VTALLLALTLGLAPAQAMTLSSADIAPDFRRGKPMDK
jgi:hypothetical protein